MRINHNISSMITQGSLYQVGKAMSSSLQRLSTGLRINAAQDDAAGLGVSENLRMQTNGLNQAIKNTQDAIALLNIADGALNEQASIIQRMRELVVQGLNSTYTTTERSYMSAEFSQLIDELDRIASVTNFNGKQIFATPASTDGPGNGVYAPLGLNQEPPHVVDGRTMWDSNDQHVFGANDNSSSHLFNIFVGANYTAGDSAAVNSLGQGASSYDRSASNVITLEFGQMDTNGLLSPGAADDFGRQMWRTFDIDQTGGSAWDNAIFDAGVIAGAALGNPDWGYTDATQTVIDTQITSNYKLNILLNVLDGSDNIDPAIRGDAAIFNAGTNTTGIKRINEMRSYIGAQTNRLEHAVNNMIIEQTNQQAAESVIRDVDFASETAEFTRSQILTQSATAMLAQANMQPQSMLSLLK